MAKRSSRTNTKKKIDLKRKKRRISRKIKMSGGNKKCILGLDNDGVFTPVTFSNNASIEDKNVLNRLKSIRKKIQPVADDNKIGIGELFSLIVEFKRDYITDFKVLMDVLDKHNLSTSIISKVGFKQGPETIPDIIMNNKAMFNQLILCPCNDKELKTITPDKIKTMHYWFKKSLTELKGDLNDSNKNVLMPYINGLRVMKNFYGLDMGDDSISFEKASYNKYGDHTSGKFVDWGSDKGDAMEKFLDGNILYFVDDDMKNLKIITKHFQGKPQVVKLFLMTHFITSDNPNKEHSVKNDGIKINYYHIDNFQQLANHIDNDLMKPENKKAKNRRHFSAQSKNNAFLYGGKN